MAFLTLVDFTVIQFQTVFGQLFFILSYFILGAGVKYIDDCFDEKVFDYLKGYLLAPILGLFWAFLMVQHEVSATILAAIVLAVFVKGKIDNLAFTIGTLIILITLILLGFVQIMWLPLLVLTIAGILDEIGNDWSDKQIRLSRIMRNFFEYRFAMKLAVFYFAIAGVFPWVFFAAFLAWDFGYALIYEYVKRLPDKRQVYPSMSDTVGAEYGKKRRNYSNTK